MSRRSAVKRIFSLTSNIPLVGLLLNSLDVARRKSALRSNYFYDFDRYVQHSGYLGLNTRNKLRAAIMKRYHGIEKALTFREPRRGFGVEATKRLSQLILTYQRKFGPDETSQIGIDILNAYRRFHASDAGSAHLDEIMPILEAQQEVAATSTTDAGAITVSRDEIHAQGKIDLRSFFASRYSIRQFTTEPVDTAIIADAVRMAQKTPSVCNRQSSRVYVLVGDDVKRDALALQTGNSGFGDQASIVLVVTSDLSHFRTAGERYQGYIDGGMFSMSLVYALHSLGLGTCCLNWSQPFNRDKELRKRIAIPESEITIMMIAVGHIPGRLPIAASLRKDLSEVMVVWN